MKRLILLAALLILPTQAIYAAPDEKDLESDINAAKSLDRMTVKTDISEMKRSIAELKRDVSEAVRDVSQLKRDVSDLKRSVRA